MAKTITPTSRNYKKNEKAGFVPGAQPKLNLTIGNIATLKAGDDASAYVVGSGVSEYCGVYSPGDQYFVCTRPKGHEDDYHLAAWSGGALCCDPWPVVVKADVQQTKKGYAAPVFAVDQLVTVTGPSIGGYTDMIGAHSKVNKVTLKLDGNHTYAVDGCGLFTADSLKPFAARSDLLPWQVHPNYGTDLPFHVVPGKAPIAGRASMVLACHEAKPTGRDNWLKVGMWVIRTYGHTSTPGTIAKVVRLNKNAPTASVITEDGKRATWGTVWCAPLLPVYFEYLKPHPMCADWQLEKLLAEEEAIEAQTKALYDEHKAKAKAALADGTIPEVGMWVERTPEAHLHTGSLGKVTAVLAKHGEVVVEVYDSEGVVVLVQHWHLSKTQALKNSPPWVTTAPPSGIQQAIMADYKESFKLAMSKPNPLFAKVTEAQATKDKWLTVFKHICDEKFPHDAAKYGLECEMTQEYMKDVVTFTCRSDGWVIFQRKVTGQVYDGATSYADIGKALGY